jgi:hypothetical protein
MSGRGADRARRSLAMKETEKVNASKNPNRSRKGLLAALIASVAMLVAALGASPAQADFGFKYFDVEYTNADGTPATQAGSHPDAMTVRFELNYSLEPGPFLPFGVLDGQLKDFVNEQVAGLVGDAKAMPRCTTAEFNVKDEPQCSKDTQVGLTAVSNIFPPEFFGFIVRAVYNVEPPPGVAVRLGFKAFPGIPVFIDIGVKKSANYNAIAAVHNAPNMVPVFGNVIELWGVPAASSHDKFRCGANGEGTSAAELEFVPQEGGFCESKADEKPFLTLPRSCTGPALSSYEIESWQEPGKWVSGGALSHDDSEPPNPTGFSGCEKLSYTPEIESIPSADSAESGSGLDFNLDVNDEGLKNPKGLAQSEAKKVEVALPEGVTVNPSIGEGLGVCTPADLERETLHSDPGAGCPNSSKIGSVRAEFPIVDEAIDGSVFLAQQDDPGTTTPGAENPFDSLIAMYFVLRNTNLGAIVKLPVKVEPDPVTGRLVTTLDDIPQFPLSHFSLHLREGQRAPLVTPAACGTYTTEAKLYPWSDPDTPRIVTSDFQVTRGVGGGPCPPAGIPPFKPSFEAGAINNNAGSFSPFNMRLIRGDGEQDMTKFSSVLPPGELGSLKGVAKCPDAAIDVAKSKTGRQELASPSCPANSLIGHTLAGAGVGSALTYVPGQLYLGGPYKGDPLSVISVTPALAGPFDAGTVVVRLALNLNPKTAEVEVDGANSDPIPHILKGIVLKVRDLRVYVDRPNFTLNPTNCDESSAKATLFGSYLDVFNPADDLPVDLSTRYQAANCLNLGFKPDLALNLKGGTKRGGHPGLSAVYKPKPGDANLEDLVVRLPRSAFLDQAHIRTICTRVQFADHNCPKAAQYGYIKAWTPLLDEPLQGPVWLRSSNHKLPDLVFDLQGLVDVEVATRIDSQNGGIRASIDSAPDAPISKVVLKMQGGKKGLIINSRNLCSGASRANVQFSGHNGKSYTANPVMRPQCGGKGKRARR